MTDQNQQQNSQPDCQNNNYNPNYPQNNAQNIYPQQNNGYNAQYNGYPPQNNNCPPQYNNYPPQNNNFPQQNNYPPQYNYPPQQYGGQNYNSYPQPYPPQYQQYIPPQPRFVPTPVMADGTPVYPRQDERKWIKRFYNWTGGIMLIHFAMALVLIFMTEFIFSAVSYLTGGGSFDILSGMSDAQTAMFYAISGVVAYPLANVLCTLIGSGVTKIKISSLFRTEGYNIKFILSAIIIALAIQSAATYLITIISTVFAGLGFDILSALDQPETTELLPNILDCISACIMAPLTEELLFRGFVLKNLSRVNIKFGIFASAFLFGLAHGNIPQFLFAFPVGILLAYITVKSGSLIPSITVHLVVNSLATLQGFIKNEELQTIICGICDIVFICAGIAVLIILLVKKKISFPKADIAKKKRGLPIFMASAPCVIVVILYIIMTFSTINRA